MTFGFFELLNGGRSEHQPCSARVNDELRIDGMHYSVPPIVIRNRAVSVNLSLTGGSGVIRTGAACYFVVVDHVTPPMRTRAVFASECEATLSRPGLVPVQRFTLTENARGVRFGEGSRQHNSQVTCQRFLLQGCPHAGQGRAFRSRIEYAPAWFTFLLGSGAPSMPRAILATLLIIVAMPVSRAGPEANRPVPPPVDGPAGPQADDGGAGDQVAPPGRTAGTATRRTLPTTKSRRSTPYDSPTRSSAVMGRPSRPQSNGGQAPARDRR